jgi:hypothetical protein
LPRLPAPVEQKQEVECFAACLKLSQVAGKASVMCCQYNPVVASV